MLALRPFTILIATYLTLTPCLSKACSAYIEEHAGGATASLRPNSSAFEPCEVSENDYRQVVGEWLLNRPADLPKLSSLSLGRAVTFPWISRHLADTALQSADWATRVSRTKAGERHRLAAMVINDPSLVQRLAVPFEGTRYEVAGISFEKVLFGNAGEYSSNKEAGRVKVPFDAQLWLRLKPRDDTGKQQ